MINKTSLSVLFVCLGIAIIAGFIWYSYQSKSVQQIANQAITNTVEFIDPSSDERVTVVFNQTDDTATLTGLGYTNLVLQPAVSASGARYVNNDEGLEVWNRGEGMTITRLDEQIFSGNAGGLTEAEKLATGTWVWQATTKGEQVIEPTTTDAFTLTFDGQTKQVNGTTDCNSIFGPYTVSDTNALTLGPLGMTKMFCPDSQETIFAEGLAQVTTFSFNGAGALVLEFASSTGFMLFGQQQP